MRTFLTNAIQSVFGSHCVLKTFHPVAGGDINMAYACQTNLQSLFIKVNSAHLRNMFETEFAALEELTRKSDFTVPQPFGVYEQEGRAALVLSYLDLVALRGDGFFKAGECLAKMHQKRQPFFGWTQDNFIGTTLQPNPRSDRWLPFYIEQRLAHQIKLLAQPVLNQYLSRLPAIETFFRGYDPQPSLLHGDLWSGNIAATENGLPVVFDPASFYGDREMDIAMTELFGGFPRAFYQGYENIWPLDTGYSKRKPVYQLYHILNHANLFGGHYIDQAKRSIDNLGRVQVS